MEKKIPLKPLDVSSRAYFNWKVEGLLNEEQYSERVNDDDLQKKKVFLNVFDALWILIIKELRRLSIDLKTIYELKQFMFTPVKKDNDKVTQFTKEDFMSFMLSRVPEEYHEAFHKELADKSIDAIFAMAKESGAMVAFNYIGILLTNVLLLHKAVSLVIIKETNTSELDFLIVANNNKATAKEKEDLYKLYATHFSKDTLINIPILPLVSRLFEDQNFDKYCIAFGLFNSHEKKLLKALNDDRCKKISIIKYDSDNIIFDITKEIDVKGDTAKEIRKILGLKQYEKVEVTYRNDKHVVIKNTQRDKN